MHRTTPCFVALIVLLSGSAARAHHEDYGDPYEQAYARPGPYLALGGVFGLNDFENEIEADLGLRTDVDDSFGVDVRLGYRWHPAFSFELQYEWLDGFDIHLAGVPSAELDGFTLGTNAKSYLLTGPVQPYLLAGAGVTRLELRDTLGLDVDGDETGFQGRLGGGVDLYATPSVFVGVHAARVFNTGSLDDLDYTVVGANLGFRF
ncbi:MAG: porin family protein [Proteobacteria bacterium]|nr:porin family protein [Pseudomonadota bacterium]